MCGREFLNAKGGTAGSKGGFGLTKSESEASTGLNESESEAQRVLAPRGKGRNKIHGRWRPTHSDASYPAAGQEAAPGTFLESISYLDVDDVEYPMPEAPAWPFAAKPVIPCLDPSLASGHGVLLQALATYGLLYLRYGSDDDGKPPAGRGPSASGRGSLACRPQYGRWQRLLMDAAHLHSSFYQRPCVASRNLRLSRREEMQRVLQGSGSEHAADNRAMFGLSDSALRCPRPCWGDLWWVLEHYRALKESVADLVRRELAPLCGEERKASTLGMKLRSGKEDWSQSALRHCFNPDHSACAEHTDAGVVTLQCCTAPGLEAHIHGVWHPVQPPPGYGVLFAGDMLERLTNGHIKAMLQRVRLDTPSPVEDPHKQHVLWQSHILFLQPDQDTLVKPLQAFCAGDGTDLPTIRYGDWHTQKVSLAFGKDLQRPLSWQVPGARGQKSAAWAPRPPLMDPPPAPPLRSTSSSSASVAEEEPIIQFQ